MRITVYRCDACNHEFVGEPHYSISFGRNSGAAYQHVSDGPWYVQGKGIDGVRHFCDTACLSRWLLQATDRRVVERASLATGEGS